MFANYPDKADHFREIMITDMGGLADAMGEAAGHGKGVEDTLLKMFGAGYSFYKTQLPLARAAFSVGWSPQDGPALRNASPVQVLRDQIVDQLKRAVEGGEIGADDLELRAWMLFESSPATPGDLRRLDLRPCRTLHDQIRILLAGAGG